MRKVTMVISVVFLAAGWSQPAHAQAPPLRSDARIRIKVGASVELPGIVRLEKGRIDGQILSSNEDTVTVRGAAGQSLHLPRPGRLMTGRLADMNADSVALLQDHGFIVTIPRTAIVHVDESSGYRSRGHSVLVGFLIGGSLGAGVGSLLGSFCHPTSFLGCPEPAAVGVAGFLLGGGAGALAGTFAPRSERWRTIAISHVP
jgi:hypothetical protein